MLSLSCAAQSKAQGIAHSSRNASGTARARKKGERASVYALSPQMDSSRISCSAPSTCAGLRVRYGSCREEREKGGREREGAHLCVERARGVVLPHAVGEVALHPSQLVVPVRREVGLEADLQGQARRQEERRSKRKREGESERTMHSNEGSRYGTRRSMSCGSSSRRWPSSAWKISRACSSSFSACGGRTESAQLTSEREGQKRGTHRPQRDRLGVGLLAELLGLGASRIVVEELQEDRGGSARVRHSARSGPRRNGSAPSSDAWRWRC